MHVQYSTSNGHMVWCALSYIFLRFVQNK